MVSLGGGVLSPYHGDSASTPETCPKGASRGERRYVLGRLDPTVLRSPRFQGGGQHSSPRQPECNAA